MLSTLDYSRNRRRSCLLMCLALPLDQSLSSKHLVDKRCTQSHLLRLDWGHKYRLGIRLAWWSQEGRNYLKGIRSGRGIESRIKDNSIHRCTNHSLGKPCSYDRKSLGHRKSLKNYRLRSISLEYTLHQAGLLQSLERQSLLQLYRRWDLNNKNLKRIHLSNLEFSKKIQLCKLCK